MSSKQRAKSERIIDRDAFEGRRRMRELAAGISTETELQRILLTVDPAMRTEVEAMIRPHTKIPKETVQ